MRFSAEKRDTPVFFPYAYQVQDAVRVSYPADWKAEAVPGNQAMPFQKFATYAMSTETGAG